METGTEELDSAWRLEPMDKPTSLSTRQHSLSQLLIYALVGFAINISGYLVYLLFTYLGANPKAAMSLLYGVGASISYIGNRKLTFAHSGSLASSSIRYVLAHAVGYLINLSILIIFVDKIGFAHQWVQAVAILIVAAFLFIALKYFVFSDKYDKH